MYLLFDIGASNMRFGLSGDGESIEKDSVTMFDTPKKFDQGIKIFEKAIEKFEIKKSDVNYASGGIAGALNKKRTRVDNSPGLPDWTEKPLKREISSLIDAKTFLDNDAIMGGLGEAHKGAGKDFKSLAYIAVGTGIGGSKIVDGKPVPRTYGFEPGHQIISCQDPENCGTGKQEGHGKYGHWEALAGGWAIKEKYSKRASELNERNRNRALEWLAVGLTNISLLWSPEVIVLGGGIIADDVFDMSRLRKRIDERLKVHPEPPELRKAELENYSGLYGALAYAKLNQ